MNEKKLEPIMTPMNREEAQRYNGIRQALMNLPDMADPNRVANPYGVYYPDPMAVKMAQQGQQTPPVQPDIPSGVPSDGMPVDPNDGGMGGAMAMPQPGMMGQQDPMQKRGLGRLMAGLSPRMMRG